MFSFIYSTLLLVHCVSYLSRDEKYYKELKSALNKFEKNRDDTEALKEQGMKIAITVFFCITEFVFYANLALHKVLFPYSAIVFFAHLILIFFTRHTSKLPVKKFISWGKAFTIGEIVFLVAYLMFRLGIKI